MGGLGIMDLHLLGVALRARWLWLHRTDLTRAWISLLMAEDNLTKAFFETPVQFIAGDSRTSLLG
jgi:hypothetical protein